MDRLAKGWFCPKCALERVDKDLKSGACATCETKAVRIEFCVRMQERSRIAYACAGCAATGDVEADFRHDETCKKKALKKLCSKSGTLPHGTPPRWDIR